MARWCGPQGDPRRLTLDGHDLAGVHAVRTRADADRLMTGLDVGANRAVVIGGAISGSKRPPSLASERYQRSTRGNTARMASICAPTWPWRRSKGPMVKDRDAAADGEVLPAQIVIVGIEVDDL